MTAYEMRIRDWSSDVCSSDLYAQGESANAINNDIVTAITPISAGGTLYGIAGESHAAGGTVTLGNANSVQLTGTDTSYIGIGTTSSTGQRSEEHTSELQSLMRISYAVFCLKKKNNHNHQTKLTYIKQVK